MFKAVALATAFCLYNNKAFPTFGEGYNMVGAITHPSQPLWLRHLPS
jgi:hypothetical protein